MKNSLFIDVDTEREQMVLIGKPPEIQQPENPQEAANMIMDDIASVCEALVTLIMICDNSGYAKKEEMLTTTLKYLSDTLENKNSDEKPEKVE